MLGLPVSMPNVINRQPLSFILAASSSSTQSHRVVACQAIGGWLWNVSITHRIDRELAVGRERVVPEVEVSHAEIFVELLHFLDDVRRGAVADRAGPRRASQRTCTARGSRGW